MDGGSRTEGTRQFLCLDCWTEYFQRVDELSSPPLRGRCNTCGREDPLVIPCKSESPLPLIQPNDGNERLRKDSGWIGTK